MRKAAGKETGDTAVFEISFDPEERKVSMHPELEKALKANSKAKKVFDSLPPSRRNEIIKYISFLKTEESVKKNVARALQFLQGKERFVGRDKP
jgi:uncharacterized protein YdeI (YjbR/CyaY-like superfamily)